MIRYLHISILVLASLALVACSSHRPLPSNEVTIADVVTGAGKIRLHHYASEGPAVLLAASPGLSARIWDVPGWGGLAPYLHSKGYDVWVLDWLELPAKAGIAQHIAAAGDVLTALAERTGPLSVVAHGYGGIPVVASGPHPSVERYVFLAVPGTLAYPLKPFELLQDTSLSFPASLSGFAGYRLPGAERDLSEDLLWSYGIAPLHPSKLGFLFEPVGPRLANDFRKALRSGEWPASFTKGLKAISAPTTVYVAQTDSVAPQWQTFETFAQTGSDAKQYRFFSRANGDNREYGHLSILVGDDAAAELYPFYTEALEFQGGQ